MRSRWVRLVLVVAMLFLAVGAAVGFPLTKLFLVFGVLVAVFASLRGTRKGSGRDPFAHLRK